MSQVF
ncbi:unnamed protein product [Callosobruchus maculatus]